MKTISFTIPDVWYYATTYWFISIPILAILIYYSFNLKPNRGVYK